MIDTTLSRVSKPTGCDFPSVGFDHPGDIASRRISCNRRKRTVWVFLRERFGDAGARPTRPCKFRGLRGKTDLRKTGSPSPTPPFCAERSVVIGARSNQAGFEIWPACGLAADGLSRLLQPGLGPRRPRPRFSGRRAGKSDTPRGKKLSGGNAGREQGLERIYLC
jgi:hypothetical protein